MKFLSKSKDGGPESSVDAYWLVEIKWLFSIAILCFNGDGRESFHDHAFNSVSWLLKGYLREHILGGFLKHYSPSWWPIVTRRDTYHRVDSYGVSYVLTFRGPWSKTWHETRKGQEVTLTHGRQVV